MKKFLIALLMMAVVFVGAFAEPLAANDKAQLTVNAEVKLQYPIFSLQATAWGTNGDGTNASLGTADVMEHGSLTPVTTVRIGDDVLTENDATITFTINQTNLSRVKGTYTLSVSATNLILDKITQQNGTKAAVSAEEKAANFFAVSGAPTIDDVDVTNTSMVTTTPGQVAITYNGKKVGSTSAVTPLATFDYTWTHDDAAAAGDYKADVTLTITSIN